MVDIEVIKYVFENYKQNSSNKKYIIFFRFLLLISLLSSIYIIYILIFKNIDLKDYTLINFLWILSISSFILLWLLYIVSIIKVNINEDVDNLWVLKEIEKLNIWFSEKEEDIVVVAWEYAYNMAIDEKKYETSVNKFQNNNLKWIIFYNQKRVRLIWIIDKNKIENFKHKEYWELTRYSFKELFVVNLPYIWKWAMVQSYKYINFVKLKKWIEKWEIKQWKDN
jgi:hypothetical protein